MLKLIAVGKIKDVVEGLRIAAEYEKTGDKSLLPKMAEKGVHMK